MEFSHLVRENRVAFICNSTMKYTLRPYQKEASDAAVSFFLDKDAKYNALEVLATATGKSVIIADIANRLKTNVLVFCPSKELIEQDYEKMCSYGVECSMYSASVGQKKISKITFATIGSVKNIAVEFADFEYIIIDEAHTVNPKKGMYKKFLKELKKKVLGVTATPYRLEGFGEYEPATKKFTPKGSYLQMLTDYARPIFKKIIFNIDTSFVAEQGYLCRPQYFVIPPKGWNNGKIKKTSNGSDYTDYGINWMQKITKFREYAICVMYRLLDKDRNGILVFVRSIAEAQEYKSRVSKSAIVSGDMDKKDREQILNSFKSGEIKILINVGVLVQGYDYPALDTVVLAAPTMSLARYTQMVGRCVRPYKGKQAWVVDLVNNYSKFGDTFDLKLTEDNGKWYIENRGQRLTGVIL